MDMLAALTLLVLAPFPSGAFGMKELCEKLTTATGVSHTVGGPLSDYPVFVSVKSGDAKRVEKLVALALHAEWQQNGSALRLTPVKPKDKSEGFDAWAKQAKSFLTKPGWAGLPLPDLYRLPSGTTFRYSETSHPYFAILPEEARQKVSGEMGEQRWIMFRKMSKGFFMGRDQITIKFLPEEIVKSLGEKGKLPAYTDAERKNSLSFGSKREDLLKMVSKNTKRDIGAVMHEPLLMPISKLVDQDLVVPLVDGAIVSLAMIGEGQPTVQAVLENYSTALDFEVLENAIVGQLPLAERLQPAQCRRSALDWVTRSVKPDEMIRLTTWGDYLSRQAPSASEAWSDAFMLMLSGVRIDDRHIADYPYNLRLGLQFTPSDWQLIRSEKRFSAAQFSFGAMQALRALLLNSLQNVQGWPVPAALWPSFDAKDLQIQATQKQELILLQTNQSNDLAGRAESAELAGSSYKWRKELSKSEPLYIYGIQYDITITIQSLLTKETVETGLTDVLIDPSVKAVPWQQLPAEYREQFDRGMKRGGPVEAKQDEAAPARATGTP